MTLRMRNRGRGAGLTLAVLLIGVAAAATAPLPGDPEVPAWDAGRPPVSIVTNGWIDVRDILPTVAANSGLGLQMAPDVQGQVNVHLEQVRLSRALDALLEPVNLGYEVVDDVVVVYRQGMVTRWFTFDYPVTLRKGRGELQVTAGREGSSGGSGGSSGSSGGGESNQNRSQVTSTATMSIWPEVMASLKVVVFDGAELREDTSGDEQSLAINLSDGLGRSLVVNPMASLVQVTAEWDRVRRAAELLDRLQESLQRQVAIEVRIMEVYLDQEKQTGINWDGITSGDFAASLHTLDAANHVGESFFQFVVNSADVTGVLEAVEQSGDLRTVSTPRVTTLNNQQAVVRVVTEDVYYEATVEPAIVSNGVGTEAVVNYVPRVVPVGVVLDVTPQVGRDRVITLNVHPTISDVVAVAESPNQDTAPVLSIRELDTVGKVRDGQTLIIAGLISQRRNHVRTGLPVLKDLPVLGLLFGKTVAQQANIELVILLTPVIMEGDAGAELARAERLRMEDRLAE
ncbi:MAG: secretin N-terminal domain-containing protein [Candidatus Krumholzibacteriia bacterium]